MKNLSDPKSWQVGFPPQTICYDEPLATHATTNTRRILDLDPALVRCSSIENSTKPQCLPMGLQAAFISPRKRKGNIGSSVSNKEGSIFQLVLKKILIQFFFFLTEGRSEIVLSTATCHFQSSVWHLISRPELEQIGTATLNLISKLRLEQIWSPELQVKYVALETSKLLKQLTVHPLKLE